MIIFQDLCIKALLFIACSAFLEACTSPVDRVVDTIEKINSLEKDTIESNEPHQPIEFPHAPHVDEGISCTECHISIEKKRSLVQVNVCIQCHSNVE